MKIMSYAMLGEMMDFDPDVIMALEVNRLFEDDMAAILPAFAEIQDDE